MRALRDCFLILVAVAAMLLCVAFFCAAANGQAVAEQVEPPQDADKLYLTVFADNRDLRQFDAMLAGDSELRALRDRVHYRPIYVRSLIYINRFKGNVPALPCIRVQDRDGNLISERYGKTGINAVPENSRSLRKWLVEDVIQGCPLRPRNWPRNQEQKQEQAPEPQPKPQDDPAPQPITPSPEPMPQQSLPPRRESEFPWPLLLGATGIAGLVGCGAGVARGFKKAHG